MKCCYASGWPKKRDVASSMSGVSTSVQVQYGRRSALLKTVDVDDK